MFGALVNLAFCVLEFQIVKYKMLAQMEFFDHPHETCDSSIQNLGLFVVDDPESASMCALGLLSAVPLGLICVHIHYSTCIG